MWNYQEILIDLKPSIVIEFGTYMGGSALFFSTILRQLRSDFIILSVDISHDLVPDIVRRDPHIRLITSSSTSPEVAAVIATLNESNPGPVFAILDSDHTKQNVLGEMVLIRPFIKRGDYLIVEDSNINGHPVLPQWGEGPYEAIQEYMEQYPSDYRRDEERESKFGFTFATGGFLVRVA